MPVSTALQPAQQKSGLAPTYPCDPLQSENRVYSASKVNASYCPEPLMDRTIPLTPQPYATLSLPLRRTRFLLPPRFSAHLCQFGASALSVLFVIAYSPFPRICFSA